MFLSCSTCYVVKDGALGICQGRATNITAFRCCMWRRGPRGNNATCLAFSRLSVTSSTTHEQIGSFWCCFPVSGFVYILGPCGSLQWTLLWGWEFLLPLQPPHIFLVKGFEALFAHVGILVLHGLSYSPVVPVGLSARKCGTTQSTSCHLACPSHPTTALSWVLSTPSGCPSPPFLQVWMNVSSLIPWLLNFYENVFLAIPVVLCF